MNPIRNRLRCFLLLLAGLMLIGVAGFMAIEGLDLGDALYFCIVTVATVGYGDISPATQTGKLFAVFIIITGVGVFLGVVANATELMLARREQEARMDKLNMVIGVFFTEVGTGLLAKAAPMDPDIETFREFLKVTDTWKDKDFDSARAQVQKGGKRFHLRNLDVKDLRDYLTSKIAFLLRLLENPNLLEHESFTNLLMAVFHLADELRKRDLSKDLPEKDLAHLGGDVCRAYKLLVVQWLEYMRHLKRNYPYLYSLSMRTNPFDKDASVVIE